MQCNVSFVPFPQLEFFLTTQVSVLLGVGWVGGVCWVCTGNLCSFALFLVPMWVAIFTAHHPWLFILDSLQDTCMRTTHILWRHCVYLVLLSVKCFLNRFICSHFVFIYKNLVPVARKVDDHECKFCAMSSSNITLHAFEDLLVFWWISNVMWSSTFRGFFSLCFSATWISGSHFAKSSCESQLETTQEHHMSQPYSIVCYGFSMDLVRLQTQRSSFPSMGQA